MSFQHFSICAVPFHCKPGWTWQDETKSSKQLEVQNGAGATDLRTRVIRWTQLFRFESASMRRHWHWFSAGGFWMFTVYCNCFFLIFWSYGGKGFHCKICFPWLFAGLSTSTWCYEVLETSLVFQPLPVQITKYIANKPYHNNCQPFPTSQVAPHEPPSHWSCHGPDEGGWLRKHKHNKQWKKVNTWDDMNIYCEYTFNKNGEWRMQSRI